MTRLVVAALVAAVFLAGIVPASAQMGPKVRFANWEFELPPMLAKAEETRDKLVLKLDPSVAGPGGGTITLRAGEPLKGDLAQRVDAEWKQLVRNRKLAATEPPTTSSLADGSEGLRRSARLPGNGVLMLDAYRTAGGVNFMIVDAASETAAQMIDGAAAMLTMTARLAPLTAVAGAGAAKPAPGAPRAADTPQQPSTRASPLAGLALPAPAAAPRPAAPDAKPIAIPKPDKARIASIPNRVLSDQEIPKYVRETVALVEAKLPQQARASGDRFLASLKAKHPGPVAIENAAIGMYAIGNLTIAVYLMGKAAAANSGDATTLNNYAAFLNMAGAEGRAIPILQNLERRFPEEPTVLNNLGQAWLGLGDAARAETFLGRAIRLAPGHSQANFTQSVIAESKGNKPAAVDAMKKSMKGGYSQEKEAHLDRLGHKITADDIPWDVPRKPDPLKLHKFLPLIPPYAQEAKQQWETFRKLIGEERQALQAREQQLAAAAQAEMARFQKDFMARRKTYSPVAVKQTLRFITYGRHQALMDQAARWERERWQAAERVEAMRRELDKIVNNPKIDCGTMHRAATRFLTDANAVWASIQTEGQLRERILWLDEYAHYLRYQMGSGEAQYQYAIAGLKGWFLAMLEGLNFETKTPQIVACSPFPPQIQRSLKLPHFEDLHCDRKYSLTVPGIGSFRGNCHYLEMEFDVLFVKGSTKEDLLTGELVKGTLEVGYSVGSSVQKLSQLVRLKGEGKVALAVEFDGNGLTDIAVVSSVEASLGMDTTEETKPIDATLGVEVRTSVISGTTLSGTGAGAGLQLGL